MSRFERRTLFTPGPLSTTASVKDVMSTDHGSRDSIFCHAIADIRQRMVTQVGLLDDKKWTCIPMQGSGTMGVESVVSSLTPLGHFEMLTSPTTKVITAPKWLVFRNGSYATRMGSMLTYLNIDVDYFDGPENLPLDLKAIETFLQSRLPVTASGSSASSSTTAARFCPYTHIGMVHCETGTGMLNPVVAITQTLIKKYCYPSTVIFVDAMSSFAGVPHRLQDTQASPTNSGYISSFPSAYPAHALLVEDCCDVLVTSSNKCVQGVPGFSLVLVRRTMMDQIQAAHRFVANHTGSNTSNGTVAAAAATKVVRTSRSYTLNIFDQLAALTKTGQFPHTPPVHAMMAFHQALKELQQEERGQVGVQRRAERYRLNRDIIVQGMLRLGFGVYLLPQLIPNPDGIVLSDDGIASSAASSSSSATGTSKEFITDVQGLPDYFGSTIVAFNYPTNAPWWSFEKFYQLLSREKNAVLYPGKVSQADTFRIGCIGDLHAADMQRVLLQVEEVIGLMKKRRSAL